MGNQLRFVFSNLNRNHTLRYVYNTTHLDRVPTRTRGFVALRFRSGSMRTIDDEFFIDSPSVARLFSMGNIQEVA